MINDNKFDINNTTNVTLTTADKYLEKLSHYPPLKSGDKYLDDLLNGGFRKGLVHLLIGPRKKNTEIMLRTAVKAFMPGIKGGSGIHKVVYIDGNNRFSPYFLSNLAISMNMNPREILSNIMIARAFNWSQMVEIAEVKLRKVDGVGLILIDGLTKMFDAGGGLNEDLNQKAFNDLKAAISGIKEAIAIGDPIVIISAPKHKNSLHKPVGGKLLTHFGCVIIELLAHERFLEYTLAQHPFIPQRKRIKWNTISEQVMARYTKWNNEEQQSAQSNNEGNSNINAKDSKKWDKTIQMPTQNGFVNEFTRIRLKHKRNRTNRKKQDQSSKNLTLDYYLKK